MTADPSAVLARRPAWPARLELIVLLAAAPLLVFPSLRPALSAAALGLLASAWLLRWVVRREPWPATPFNLGLLLLVLATGVSSWVSALPELTIPKLTGIILGLAVLRVLAFGVHDRRSFQLGLGAFALAGAVIWAVGVLGTGWTGKVALLQPIVARLPRIFTALPETAGQGVNANHLAGVLVLYWPVAVACAVGAWRERRMTPGAVALFGALIAGGTLLLTQSRSAWIGAIAASLVLLVAMRGRTRWLLLIAAAVLLLASIAVLIGVTGLGDLAGADPTSGVEQVVGRLSLSGRAEIWSRALYAIQDFPFTGTGLGTFRRVVHVLYPLFTIDPAMDFAHAHNIFLQVGVDLGLPGLVAYVAVLLLALALAWRGARAGPRWLQAPAAGLLAGLVGLHVYGLTDALALGSKPGIAFWMALGLVAALPALRREEPTGALARSGSSSGCAQGARSGPLERRDPLPPGRDELGDVHRVVGGEGRPDAAGREEEQAEREGCEGGAHDTPAPLRPVEQAEEESERP